MKTHTIMMPAGYAILILFILVVAAQVETYSQKKEMVPSSYNYNPAYQTYHPGTAFTENILSQGDETKNQAASFSSVPAVGRPNLALSGEFPAGATRYIMLQDGTVFSGRMNDLGEQVRMELPYGVVAFSKSQLMCIADDLQGLYAYQLKRIQPENGESILVVIRWCMQNGLLSQAQELLQYLEKQDPSNPALKMMRMRMDALNASGKSPEHRGVSGSPSESSTAGRGPSVAELNRMAKSLPDGALELYSKRVQPVLTRNCMTSGCHGPDAPGNFRLLRMSGNAVTRNNLLRNINATLQQINFESPEKSPLLRKPVTTHGPGSRVIFANKDYETYQILIAWVYLIAKNEYVIPRERLLPSARAVPVLMPTADGLIPVTQYGDKKLGIEINTRRIHASLTPQKLYPSEYPNLQPQLKKGSVILPASGMSPSSGNIHEVSPSHSEQLFYDPHVTPASALKSENPGVSNPEISRNSAGVLSPSGPSVSGIQPSNSDSIERDNPPKQVEYTLPHHSVKQAPVQSSLAPSAYPETAPLSPLKMLFGSDGIQSFSEGNGEYVLPPSEEIRSADAAQPSSETINNSSRNAPAASDHSADTFLPWMQNLKMMRAMGNDPLKKD